MVQIPSALDSPPTTTFRVSVVFTWKCSPLGPLRKCALQSDMVRTALRDALAKYKPSSYRASLKRGATIDVPLRHYKWTSGCPLGRGLFREERSTPHQCWT